MSHVSNETTTLTRTDRLDADVSTVSTAPASTKDSGRVKVGGVGIRFKAASVATKDAGRVRVGGVGIRF